MALNFKKLGVPLLACALLMPASLTFAGSVAAATDATKSTADFSDLKDLDAATKAKFDALIGAGVFDGMGDDKFGVKEEMNRAQFAKVAALIFGLKADESLKTSSFKDVKADDTANGYALPYIEALKAAGMTAGVGDGAYDPAGKVTKEQLAAFLLRGLGLEKEAKATPGVNDATVSDWAKGYVALAVQLKVLSNGADGKFGGSTNATRDLLVLGSYEAAKQYEQPLSVSEAKLDSNEKLTVGFTTAIDPKSIKLSNIKINGVALDDTLDSFELSADGKTLVIKLRKGFSLSGSSTPKIEVQGISSKFNKTITEPANPIVVTVTNPPVTSTPSGGSGSGSGDTPPATLSVTSVTYTRDEGMSNPYVFNINYTPSVTGTVYYAIVPVEIMDISIPVLTAQQVKDIAMGYGEGEIGSYSRGGVAQLTGTPNADLISIYNSSPGEFSVYFVVQVGSQLSNVYRVDLDNGWPTPS